METSNPETESKYHSKLNGDTALVIGMLALLVGAEGYIVYQILSATWEISSSFFYLYIIFFGLVALIEGIGCIRVRESIKTHMFEFEYYD